MYPAIVNCTTIDWFGEWPTEALLEVAHKSLDHIDLPDSQKVRVYLVLTVVFGLQLVVK